MGRARSSCSGDLIPGWPLARTIIIFTKEDQVTDTHHDQHPHGGPERYCKHANTEAPPRQSNPDCCHNETAPCLTHSLLTAPRRSACH